MSTGWAAGKVEEFRKAFFEFLENVFIDSKEKGGGYCLADGVYDAQHRLINGIFEGLAQAVHDFKILKSRQLGISTISEALFVFWLGMFSGIQAACILDTAGHLKEARLRIKNLIKRLPPELGFPTIVEDSRELLTLSNGSTVRWMAAGVRETESSGGLGRGSGINLVWASEVSSWKNEEGIVSLQETLSETFPDRLYIFESTARGYNAWRDMYLDAKKDDLNQKAIFIGWWAHPGHVIVRSDRRFAHYGEKEPTTAELKLIEQVKSECQHDITREQLAWLRFKIDPTRDAEDGEKKGSQFKTQEQPSVESDSFQQAGSSFFDHVALNNQTNRAVTYAAPKRYRYHFGTEFQHTVISQAMNWREVELRIWDAPQEPIQYIVSADVAYGRNPDNDRSACQVLACYADCIEQVAEYASATTNTQQYAWVIASLAAWYKNVTVIIELDGPGEAVWKEYERLPALVRAPHMRQAAEERGLTNIFNNVQNYIFNRPDAMSASGNNWHWKTGARKEAIMETLKALNHTGAVVLKSTDCIEEMRTIARDGASISAPSHKHDDRTLALAIGVRAWEDRIRPGLIGRGRTKQQHEDSMKMTTPARYAIYMDNTISQLFARSARQAQQTRRAERHAAAQQRRR